MLFASYQSLPYTLSSCQFTLGLWLVKVVVRFELSRLSVDGLGVDTQPLDPALLVDVGSPIL